MLHTRPDTLESWPVETTTKSKARYVILGRFSAANGVRAQARQMAHRLKLDGNTVTTVADAPTPAHVALRFHSQRYWRQTLLDAAAIVEKPFSVILYVDGLGFGSINKPHWRSRNGGAYDWRA
jgi:hypothetical protein